MWTQVVLSNAVAFSSLTWLFLTIHGFLTASVMNSFWSRNLRRPVFRATARLFKLHQTVFLPSKSTPVSTTASPDSPVLLPASTPIEEEELPGYVAQDYYPTRIAQVFESRYRVLCKLGRGTGSTVWLAKDLWCVFLQQRGRRMRGANTDIVMNNIVCWKCAHYPRTALSCSKPRMRLPCWITSSHHPCNNIRAKPSSEQS